jgi:citrate synthase
MDRLTRIACHVNASGHQAPLSPVPTLADSPIIAKMKSKMVPLIKEKIALKTKLLKENGDTKIQDLTVEMCINGARSAKAMVTDTSDLDAMTGIAYRHLSLYEVNEKLPKAKGGEVALPEGAFWLLLTGEEPTEADVNGLTEEFHKRAGIPQYVTAIMDALPKDMHPMTQIAMAMLALQKESKFQAAYDSGMKKDVYWEYALEDSLDLAAKIPVIAARIYHRTFKNGAGPAYDSSLDWAGNYAQMLGTSKDPMFKEATRLYLMLHADHEGGNVSAHTSHLVGSALSDPYYSVAAGLCGLAGPLHGLANQECLVWLLQVQKDLGDVEPTKEVITEYAKKTLAAGKVIPGFGHAVLRNTDPRYMLEREFAVKHMQGDPLFKLVDACFQALPPLLGSLGKVKNPNPNVDAHSGQIMSYYGLTEQNYYTVVFAVSRSLGIVSQIVWARAIGLPIERPKSVPLDVLAKLAQKK